MSKKHVGVLVIHGIGEENCYGTLDQFVRGLARHFTLAGGAIYSLQTVWRSRKSDPAHARKSWIQADVVFQRAEDANPLPGATADPDSIDVAEYYWSPITKGKLKDLDVLYWLLSTGLSPFRYISENLQSMERTGAGGSGAKAGRAALLFGREILRLVLLYTPLLASFLLVAFFLNSSSTLLKTMTEALSDRRSLFALAFIVGRLLVLYALANYLLPLLRPARMTAVKTGSTSQYTAVTIVGAILFALLLLALPFWIFPGGQSPCGLAIRLFVGDCRLANLLKPLIALAAAALIRNFLINYVGDVAIYANLNERSSNFAIRSQILEESIAALCRLHSDMHEKYQEEEWHIAIAAHSLGSVIAYDTVNETFNRAHLGDSQAVDICKRLRGMLTFGSPLNKIYYFFRDQSKAEETVRSQIIDDMHRFRLCTPGQSNPVPPLTKFPRNPLIAQYEAGFKWLNFWTLLDPVCGKLFFYRLDDVDQVFRPFYSQAMYWVPVLAHLGYWTDEAMYARFASDLLR